MSVRVRVEGDEGMDGRLIQGNGNCGIRLNYIINRLLRRERAHSSSRCYLPISTAMDKREV